MKTSKPRLILEWLKLRRALLILFVGMLGIFFVVYALYGYPFGVAGYAALICAVFGLCFAIVDFSRFVYKHSLLSKTAGKFPLGMLPNAENLIENDYKNIAQALETERLRLESTSELERKDAEEYYTLWAHQIKTPMAAMRLLLQAKNANFAAAGEDLQQELFRIGQYVEMVLQYQRLSTIENDLDLAKFPLEALVKKAAKTCAPLFIHKGLGLDVGGVAGFIITDEKWFCFVLEQLFTNAAKYTAKGTIKVYSQNACTLVVQDCGTGIAAEDLPRVFERGFTGAIGRSERSSTGIGLYLCKRILANLGFGVSITSATGQGTKVFLHLAQDIQKLD